MHSTLTTIGLPIALAVIMLGLGLSLTPDDFSRALRSRKAVLVALVCQIVVLPAVAFALVVLFDLEPFLAVGFMLLAASPGGTTANLFSHLFRGDVALNVTLTAINSVLAIVTLPVITNLALGHFLDGEGEVGLQLGKMLSVFAVVLVPVAIGMLVRRRNRDFADRMDQPVRIASAAILVLVIVGAILGARDDVGGYIADVGLVSVLFCAISLSTGFFVPRALGVSHRQAVATSFEIGVHNSTLAITVALTALDQEDMAVPAAVYGVLMFFVAAGFGRLITRGRPSTSWSEAARAAH
ncbi:bile acid:sodium symporter family protein [Luteipulveratus sp. YIM 133132]|uniref:Bile acid:sodium symporter family protein n=1 Tax=Luteipulveratus flavus TaxID=3031728 RepID=A0ABT6C8R1_9MICO|nr:MULTISPECIES: bile acid:sodium symporter family protein [unclassified Luteipulveratus]MDE9366185.1 bile acid:sodium symporter family protein [Luteipulveratus sp. YIM 133132]MDF8265275.1 bile acid:sodium symporter family protein [Luteipulveratus sp. YIM 133296]